MSELTRCNYCDLEWIKKDAQKDGLKVMILSSNFELGGYEIFTVPKNILKKEIKNWEIDDENWRKYHRAWMWSIPDRCCC